MHSLCVGHIELDLRILSSLQMSAETRVTPVFIKCGQLHSREARSSVNLAFDISALNKRLRFCLILVCIWFLRANVTGDKINHPITQLRDCLLSRQWAWSSLFRSSPEVDWEWRERTRKKQPWKHAIAIRKIKLVQFALILLSVSHLARWHAHLPQMPSVLWSEPMPPAAKHPHNMMLLPPCFVVGVVFFGLQASPFFLQMMVIIVSWVSGSYLLGCLHCFPCAMSRHVIILITYKCILIYISPVCPRLGACVWHFLLLRFVFHLRNRGTDFLLAERLA